MPHNRLVECEVVLSGSLTADDAVEFLANEVGDQTHEVNGGTIEVCEFWENEEATPRQVALLNAREEVTAAAWAARAAIVLLHRQSLTDGSDTYGLLGDLLNKLDAFEDAGGVEG